MAISTSYKEGISFERLGDAVRNSLEGYLGCASDLGEKEKARYWEYLEEEIGELDLMCQWGEIHEAWVSDQRTLNPDRLLSAFLMGLCDCDPLRPHTFVRDDVSGLEEPGFTLWLEGDVTATVYKEAHVLVETGTSNPGGVLMCESVLASKLRPGWVVNGRRIMRIFPARAKFSQCQSDQGLEYVEDGYVSLVSVASPGHKWNDTNEFPDIDVDFAPEYLEAITEWAKQHFGVGRVASVCTYQRFGPKSTIKAAARVYEIPYMEVNAIIAALPDDADRMAWDEFVDTFPEIQEFLARHSKMAEICERLQRRVSYVGTHPSAIVISSVDLNGRIPLIRQPSTGALVSAWVEGQDRQDLSTFGFIKFDRLGVKTLSDIQRCIGLIREQKWIRPDQGLFRLPGLDRDWSDEAYLYDEEALSLASQGLTQACFQMDSSGMRHMLKEIRIERFEEMTAANALYRPGILKAEIDGVQGGQNVYIGRKHGTIKYEVPEVLKPKLDETYGLMVYQEQVMAVLNEIGGIPLPECETARKAISKKRVDKVMRLKARFCAGAKRTIGWDPDKAGEFFDKNIIPWSGYGFNKCIDPNSIVEHDDGRSTIALDVVPGDHIKAFDPDTGRVFFDEVVKVHDNGIKDVFEITLDNGAKQICTMDHEFVCEDGQKRRLKDIIDQGHRIMAAQDSKAVMDVFNKRNKPTDRSNIDKKTILQTAALSASRRELANSLGISTRVFNTRLRELGMHLPDLSRPGRQERKPLTKEEILKQSSLFSSQEALGVYLGVSLTKFRSELRRLAMVASDLSLRANPRRTGRESWNKGRTRASDHRLDAIATKHTGKGNPAYGKAAWNTGKTKDTDPRIAMIASKRTGLVCDDEARSRMSASARARTIHGMKGKTHSVATKDKLRRATLAQMASGRMPQTATRPHLAVRDELVLMRVPFQEEVRIGVFSVDFMVGNLAIEVQGDYWHSNPAVYPAGPITKGQRINFLRDQKKTAAIQAAGMGLVMIWETEVNNGEYRNKLRNAIAAVCDSCGETDGQKAGHRPGDEIQNP